LTAEQEVDGGAGGRWQSRRSTVEQEVDNDKYKVDNDKYKVDNDEYKVDND